MTVTVVDDEESALMVGTAGVQTGAVEVREGSTTTAAYTLALGVVPTGAVTVGNGNESAVGVTPVANDADGEHERVTVTHTLTGATEYAGSAGPPMVAEDGAAETLTETDDAGVVVSRQALTVVVGGTNTYTVVLAAQMAGPVTVDTDANPESRALVFSAGNWQTPRVVTVTGVTATGGTSARRRTRRRGMGT